MQKLHAGLHTWCLIGCQVEEEITGNVREAICEEIYLSFTLSRGIEIYTIALEGMMAKPLQASFCKTEQTPHSSSSPARDQPIEHRTSQHPLEEHH